MKKASVSTCWKNLTGEAFHFRPYDICAERKIHSDKVVYSIYVDDELRTMSIGGRPYRLGYGAKLSDVFCVHSLFITFCRHHCLSPEELYLEAYPARFGVYDDAAQKEILSMAREEGVVVPDSWSRVTYYLLKEALILAGAEELASVLAEAMDWAFRYELVQD